MFVGGAKSVGERLAAFAAATGAHEIMITTPIFEHAARRRSYELLALAFGLRPPGGAGP
jgi:alkanesulfonate monooxygenase SsuD/methylene tetrahydromethanopterin reductase-like flavin-dependent oxidoreductase (luciferase family)